MWVILPPSGHTAVGTRRSLLAVKSAGYLLLCLIVSNHQVRGIHYNIPQMLQGLKLMMITQLSRCSRRAAGQSVPALGSATIRRCR